MTVDECRAVGHQIGTDSAAGPDACMTCRPPADPDRACPHEAFACQSLVTRHAASDTDPTIIGFSADITIACHDCGEKFRWIGIPAGFMPDRPMVSVDEFELRAPIRPASADPDFGLGLPGFAVRYDG